MGGLASLLWDASVFTRGWSICIAFYVLRFVERLLFQSNAPFREQPQWRTMSKDTR